jgi:LmbE family N-acetylglucosaminyl deacetylase
MKALFISPHTDDVELGAGGTLTKLMEKGWEILWVVFSTAESSLPEGSPPDTLRKEFLDVANSIGLKENNLKIFDFQVRYLSSRRQEILEEMVKMKKEFSPNLVVGPSLDDNHQDHEVVAKETLRAFKDCASIICYELPWNHITFNTQLFVKVKERHIAKKIELLKRYKSQIALDRPYFQEDYIRGWAKMRGVQVKSEFAEAFEVVRWII